MIWRIGLTTVLVGVAVAGLTVLVCWRSMDVPLTVPMDTVIDVKSGESLRGLANRLGDASIIECPDCFVAYGRLTGQSVRVQAGEYQLTSLHTPRKLLDDLVAGRAISYEVRILEGWTLEEALAALRRAPKLRDDLPGVTTDDVLDRLGVGTGSGEGRFFPDTYHYRRDTPLSDMLRVAYDRMNRVLDDAWARRDDDLPYVDRYQALVLASIVEKETGREDERTRISRVFVSRLQRGMRLQSDPTVIYGLGGEFQGDLKRIHLETDGPYNSYRRAGLPPTPISLPGLASIEAAMHPASGDYLYFVARGDGTSIFTSTPEDHTAAVRRYQLEGAAKP